jgi:hypothetical protein
LVKDASGNLLVGTATTSTLSGYTVVGQFKNSIGIVSGSADEFSGALLRESSGSNSISLNADPGNLRAGSFLGFGVDGSERMRITSAGNVGIGTSAPSLTGLAILTGGQNKGVLLARNAAGTSPTSGQSFGSYAFKGIMDGANSNAAAEAMIEAVAAEDHTGATAATNMLFYTKPSGTGPGSGPTERMRIDSSGNVVIGGLNSTGSQKLHISSSGTVGIRLDNQLTNTWDITNDSNLIFTRGGTERMRIDSSGDLLVGTTTGTIGTGNFGAVVTQSGGIFASRNQDGSVANFYFGGNAGAFQVLGNGNAQNTNNSYGAISDVKLKENIVDASAKLADLMQVKVRNYNLIGDTTKQIGVVAQELETVFPAMVEETLDRDAEGSDLGTTTKSVKYSVFVPMLIKAMQEQQAIIEQLKARLDAANL